MEMNYQYQHQQMYDMCKQHMHSYVLVEMSDGTQVDGIITGLDGDNVYMAVPIGYGEQMPFAGQMSHSGQMPYAGQMPYYGSGQMPYSGQMPHYGQTSHAGGYQYHNCNQRQDDIGGFGYGNVGYSSGYGPSYGSGYSHGSWSGYGYGPGYGYNYGYGYSPNYGYNYGYGHHPGYGRPRRFNRMVLPLAGLTALAALPWY